jgi:hypothetical protein
VNELRRVLSRHAVAAPTLGGAGDEGRRRRDDHADLRTDLNRISARNLTFFWICFAALCLLFVVSGVILVKFIGEPKQLERIYAVTGLSIVGIVAQMVKLWKEKTSADLILVLARRLRPDETRGILEILLKNL